MITEVTPIKCLVITGYDTIDLDPNNKEDVELLRKGDAVKTVPIYKEGVQMYVDNKPYTPIVCVEGITNEYRPEQVIIPSQELHNYISFKRK